MPRCSSAWTRRTATRDTSPLARILIVGGGCRGRRLSERSIAEGHAVRMTTRTEDGRRAIEHAGAEPWVGTPMRLATLRGALDRVTVACWMLGTASGAEDELRELFGPRLELFMTQAIDTTVRGVVYEAAGTVPANLLADGQRLAAAVAEKNSIPFVAITAEPADADTWLAQAAAAVDAVLAGR